MEGLLFFLEANIKRKRSPIDKQTSKISSQKLFVTKSLGKHKRNNRILRWSKGVSTFILFFLEQGSFIVFLKTKQKLQRKEVRKNEKLRLPAQIKIESELKIAAVQNV